MATKKRSSRKAKSPSRSDISKSLAKLKRKGLFGGEVRKPTRYGASIAKKYRDVLSGSAQIVTVPKTKGKRAAVVKAKELEGEFSNIVRRYKNKLLVRLGNPQKEKAAYSAELDTLVTRYRNNLGETIQHRYVRHANLDTIGEELYEIDETDRGELWRLASYGGSTSNEDLKAAAEHSGLPDLAPNESYVLPLSRGTSGLNYDLTRATKEEILALAYEYESKANHPFKNAAFYIQIRSTIAGPGQRPKRKRKSRAKVNRTGRNAPRVSAASNVIPFGARKRGKT